MRILAVIKQVPDSNAAIKIAADGKSLDTTGLKLVMNPFGEFAVEQAVQIREKGLPVDEIAVLTVGGDKSTEILRTALAMGADRGIHINDESLSSHDELFLAEVVALAIKQQSEPFDLILCGKQDIDMDAGEFGPALAEFLNLPHVGAAVAIDEITETQLVARRRVEGAEEVMASGLPAIMTCEKGLVEPRYPSLPNLMKAKKKPVDTLGAGELEGATSIAANSEMLGLTPPPARTECHFIEGEPQEMAKELVRLLREEAKVI